MKRMIALLVMLVMLFTFLPLTVFAAKQMEDNVPVWTEDTVRQYVLDYVEGKSMERLYGYFDLQIRRYMPNESFENLLVDWHWMTGNFLGLGSYRSFSEPVRQLKTHVVHLCMEKQDLELYFTHKDKDNDWEIMAIEFVPAAEENVLSASDDMLVVSEEESLRYNEEVVTIGTEPYLLEGILTLPDSASESSPVPACILIHDEGAYDRDLTLGKTTLFKDIAEVLVDMGIATLRYDKRTYTYPEAEIETVSDEVLDDALSAIRLLQKHSAIDSDCIVLLGMGFGGQLVPRLAANSNAVAGLILLGVPSQNYLQYLYNQNKDNLTNLSKQEAETVKNAVRNITNMKEEKARELTLFGKNGYYYWEMLRHDFIKQIKNLRIPVYFIQGRNDPYIDEYDLGVKELNQQVGTYKLLYTYQSFRGLNRLLMDDRTVNTQGVPEYQIEAHLDRYAGMKIGEWISNLRIENKK